MIEFTVNGVRYIGVEVPDDVAEFGMGHGFLQSYTYKGGIKLNKLPPGNNEIIGLVKYLLWDKRCAIRNVPNTYYDQSVIGRDMVEFDVTHYDKEAEDWQAFKRTHNLTDNTLILKIKENE